MRKDEESYTSPSDDQQANFYEGYIAVCTNVSMYNVINEYVIEKPKKFLKV